MSCNSCGNGAGFNGNCNSCSKVPDIDTETALETIKNGDENFCFNEVTDEICKNLQGDKGIHPHNGKNHNDCEDLHALNTYLMGDLWNSLKTLDFCNPESLRCWLYELISNLWNMFKAIICAICGLWDAIHDLQSDRWEISTRAQIEYATPEMEVTIDRSTGDFQFKFSDWKDPSDISTRLGRGIISGKVAFGMRSANDKSFDWQIRSVTIDTVRYITEGKPKTSDFRIDIYCKDIGENLVYRKDHDCTKSFTENINKTFPIDMKGNVGIAKDSGWIQFLTVFNQNIKTNINDLANVQIIFKNNIKPKPPEYI